MLIGVGSVLSFYAMKYIDGFVTIHLPTSVSVLYLDVGAYISCIALNMNTRVNFDSCRSVDHSLTFIAYTLYLA